MFCAESLHVQGQWIGQVLAAATSLLNHLVTWVTSGLFVQKEDAQQLLELLYSLSFVPLLLHNARNYGNYFSGKTVSQMLNVLSELVLSSSKFLAHFVDAEGLQVLDALDCGVFDVARSNRVVTEYSDASSGGQLRDWAKYSAEALISGLQISSQLARHSEQHFRSLLQVFTANKLALILQNANAVVRAKACNLIGNLCRHSDRFYGVLASPVSRSSSASTLLDLLTACCADADPSTRKFASFAGAVYLASLHCLC
jgi:hypothetical protein